MSSYDKAKKIFFRGSLYGLPMSIKECYQVKGYDITLGELIKFFLNNSEMLENELKVNYMKLEFAYMFKTLI